MSIMRNDKRTIFGWAMYDWANSAYTTTTLAVLMPALFTGEIMPDAGFTILGPHLRRRVAIWIHRQLCGPSGVSVLARPRRRR